MKRRDTFKAYRRKWLGVDCADCELVYVIEKGISYSSDCFAELIVEGVDKKKILEIARLFIGKKVLLYGCSPREIEINVAEILPPENDCALFVMKDLNGILQPFYKSLTFTIPK